MAKKTVMEDLGHSDKAVCLDKALKPELGWSPVPS